MVSFSSLFQRNEKLIEAKFNMIYIPKLKFGNLRTLEAFLKTLEFDFCSIKIEDLEKIDQGTLLIPGMGIGVHILNQNN